MFNMNERVYNPQSQIQSLSHQVSMFHPQASQVVYPQPSMIHLQSYQVIHPQSYQVIYQQTSQAPAVSLQSSTNPIQVDSSLVVPYLLPTDDPFECLHKYLTFMSTILALSYPSSNNQLETSSNPMHQVAMPERQTLSYVGNCSMGNDHIARPYTQSKKIQFRKQGFMTTNALFQADGVEVYDSNCDDVPNTQPSFMANISSFGSEVLSEGRQISVATGTTRTYTLGASGSNSGKQMTIICYNCKGEGDMSKQCTKPKRKRDDS
ncbi:hypothetical protein Tco_0659648 [Tanacetum coccineum]